MLLSALRAGPHSTRYRLWPWRRQLALPSAFVSTGRVT
jgi:hypothetical protein